MEPELMEKEGDPSESLEGSLGERRSSVMRLQGMLKRVSQSPFHSKYKSLVPSTSDSSEASMNDSQAKQDGELLIDISSAVDVSDNHDAHQRPNGLKTRMNPFLPAAENGGMSTLSWNPFYSTPQSGVREVNGGLSRDNPFATQIKDSGIVEVDEENNILQNPEALGSGRDFFRAVASSQATLLDLTSDAPPITPTGGTLDGLRPTPSDQIPRRCPAVPPKPKPKPDRDPFPTKPSRPTPGVSQAAPPSPEADLFPSLLSTRGSHALQSASSSPAVDFETPSSTQKDVLLESLLSHEQADAFRTTPLSQNAMSDVNQDVFPDPPPHWQDIFQATPSNTSDVFQTPPSAADDLFQPLPSNAWNLLSATPASLASDIFQTPPSVLTWSNKHDLFAATPTETQGVSQAMPMGENYDLFLTTPSGTKHDIIEDTPLDMKNGMPQDSSPETPEPFKRAPPRPTPRSRYPRVPSQKLPTPAPRTKASTPETEETEAKEDYPVYEDVLLIGQERCVEDWPEDSPQLSPDWKPAGRLRLRRESLRIAAELDGSHGEEDHGKKHWMLKTGRKFKVSFLSRRGSKDKFADEIKEGDGNTLRRGSKEKYHNDLKDAEGNTLRRGAKDVFIDDDFSSFDDEEPNGTEDHKPRKPFKFRVPRVHRRESKVKSPHEGSVKASDHLAPPHGSKEDDLDEVFREKGADLLTGGENKGEKRNGMADCRPKKPLTFKCTSVRRQSSKDSFAAEPKLVNGHAPSKYSKETAPEEMLCSTAHGWPEEAVLDGNSEEDGENKGVEDGMGDYHGQQKKKLKIKFVPHRGYAISLSKENNTANEMKGAHGYTPRRISKKNSFDETEGENGCSHRDSISKDTWFAEAEGTSGYTSPWQSKDTRFAEVEGAVGYTSPWESKNGPLNGYTSSGGPKEDYPDEVLPQKGADLFKAGDSIVEEQNWMEDCRPKAPLRLKVPLRRGSQAKEKHLEETSDMDSEYYMHRRRTKEDYLDNEAPQKGADLFKAGDIYCEEQNEMDDCKLQKPYKSRTHGRGSKSKVQCSDDPPGATSGDYYVSEAAKAEWRSSQMDVRRANGPEDEEKLEGVQEEEEGDTDSLMEWWNMVELWDELPSDEEVSLKEEETKSFTDMADKVQRALRVFNQVFTERAEVLYLHVMQLHAIADDLSNFHRRAKIASITGSTTATVGGVAAIAGLALAPLTFGASLIVSAVGLGVAAAGGVASASAAISDNVNNLQDRKKMEAVAEDYGVRLADVRRCLRFVDEGLRRLRRHPLLRRNNYYAGDWEVRRALQMVSLVSGPAERALELVERATAALAGLYTSMDKFFSKEVRGELKKGCKKEATNKVRQVAQLLHEGLVELNRIREELLDASGNI